MCNTVLLVMDMQDGIIARYPDCTSRLAPTAATLTAARAAAIPIVYVRVSFRAGAPEVSERNKMGARVKTSGGFVDGSPETQIAAAIAPADGDVLVTKRRVSAFSGSDLDAVLRGLDAQRLVLAGFSTSGVVLSTLRQAADLDFRITVLRDLCWDPEQDVHDLLMDKIFPRQAEVVTSAEWLAGLGDQ